MLEDYCHHEQAVGLDWYRMDPNLALLLDQLLPDPEERQLAERHVAPFGQLVGTAIAARAEQTDKHGPVLHRYDRWGREVDRIEHSQTWLDNKADLVRAGFVDLSRLAGRPVPGVVTAARAYLVSQAETAVYCGLGMTGGAADIVARYGPEGEKDRIVDRLTSLDPDQAWEGGMFLTERQGGSDVGANTTRAVPDGEEWRLFGEKHFCSNVDAEVFVVLARPEGAPSGSRGLATFIVPRLLPDGQPNGFRIKRLKPKLGTVGVPTAEVALEGARAWLAGPSRPQGDAARDGRGINRMMEMVNASRFGVALMGLGIHRRCFLEAAIYAARRQQFGRRIDSYPLVREALVDLAVELEAGMALTFECAAAARHSADAEQTRGLRRILVPLAKVRATRAALGAATVALELFGGNGYMEDWPMARQLRDAQCHTIWEGTENICCIDVRRAVMADSAHLALFSRVEAVLEAAGGHKALGPTVDAVATTLAEARQAASWIQSAPEELASLQLRRFAYLLADLAEAALLAEEAAWSIDRRADGRKAVVARRFSLGHLEPSRLRSVTEPDRSVIDLFEPLVRYGALDPEEAAAA
ncbi:MAG TPA: acyl-CoA dehydrogenase family protein [Acidimicrobiales bacterium]|nr:acyl-CoA dehydrogenase family protein [Acidimicrobiales bacterium]